MAAARAPERGDVVWLHFNPQAGSEQAGRRPALVISPKSYNQRVGLALVCPITSKIKGYPFEVELPQEIVTEGAILCDQIKSLDWRVRNAKLIGAVPKSIVQEVTARILALVDPDE
ncbi:MAG TPA: endoribonuclease MazF [Acidobacteriota bacterium]|nr:endoribonuclease MazF [Acidobacteriota bacterium]